MKTIYHITCLIAIIFLNGCTQEWLDINYNPNQSTNAKVNLLLPGAQYDIANYFSMGYMSLGYKTGVYIHQITTTSGLDKYGISGSDIQHWDNLYVGPIKDLDKIIEIGTENKYSIYVGIAKILKAYVYSQMVDLWGDIPFSEANKVKEGILSPSYDKDTTIYLALFKMIDKGIVALNNSENNLTPSTDDLIYGGNTGLWIKAANTLKLKLYNQIRLTSLFDPLTVQTLLEDQLIEEGEDFMFRYRTSRTPDNRNPGMADEYSGTQIKTFISPWFYELMKGENLNILTGIEDPRIPYYFCNQSGGTTQNNPEYMNGNFVSIYFGSDGINRNNGGRGTYSMVGFYPCGGRYDDNNFTKQLKADDATGDAPMRFITYADRLFIEAELAIKGQISSDARTLFKNAIEASFSLIDQIANKSVTDQSIPQLANTSTAKNYISNVLAKYDTYSTEKQFELIMTEKWIQSWGSNIDSYTDYRRTGYPILFNPKTDTSDGGPNGSGEVPTSSSRDYVVSFPYPDSESEINPNANEQKDITKDKVFWDID
jgi:hypothetical protein